MKQHLQQRSGGTQEFLKLLMVVFALTVVPCSIAASIGSRGGYSVTYLGELAEAGATLVHGINQFGQIVGESGGIDGDGVSAFDRKMSGSIEPLEGLPGGDFSQAFGVNNHGLIVGSSNTSTTLRAVLWTLDGKTQEIGTLRGDNSSQALGVNSRDEVVGFSSGPHGTRAFLWTKQGGMRDIGGLPGSDYTEATAINDLGQVAGMSGTAGATHAFLWTPGRGMLDLGTLPGDRSSRASALNNFGQIVGASHGSRGTHGFFWTKSGGMRDVGVLTGANYSEALAINDAGQVVGLAGDRGFLWTRVRGLQDLNVMLPSDSDVHIVGAFAINGRGQIAAYGGPDHLHTHHFNAPRAYLLTPSATVKRRGFFCGPTLPAPDAQRDLARPADVSADQASQAKSGNLESKNSVQ